jgi:pyruvate/2-oxoglutarate dehydrogenase complex dihydrolipoamide dehydrogenase (E3) component
MAGTSTVTPDWAPVALRIREEATTYWDDKIAVDRFTGKGGTFHRGRGRITAPGEVTVAASDGQRVFRAGRGIVIATGSRPAVPPIPGLAGTPYWTNRDAATTETVPESLVVLGGGAVGCELAQAFARFGARVTIVEALDRLLPGDEPEAGALLADVFTREGITVRTGTAAAAVRHDDGGFTVDVGDTPVTGERLLVATGRRADLAPLGVDQAGLDPDAKAIATDDHLRAAPGVWALGDVTGRGQFTHMAVYQAGIVAADILGEDPHPAEYHAVPRVTFTDPEVGAVGRTEAQARDQDIDVRTGIAQVPSTARGWIHKAGNDGLIKIIADRATGRIIGATSMGPWGGEVLSGLAVAVHAGVAADRLAQMIYAYPTFHRGIEDALRDLH